MLTPTPALAPMMTLAATPTPGADADADDTNADAKTRCHTDDAGPVADAGCRRRLPTPGSDAGW